MFYKKGFGMDDDDFCLSSFLEWIKDEKECCII